MVKNIHLLLVLLALPLTAVAGDGLWSRFTFLIDTAYVVHQPCRFSVCPNVRTSFGQFTMHTARKDIPTYDVMSAPIFKVGATVSVYGIAAGIHRDVEQLFSKSEEMEYSLSGYLPYLGGDASYSSSKTHTLNASDDDAELWSHTLTGCHTRRFLANGYLVLNPRRFSLPAAMTQRYKQLKSAGSVIVGVSATGFRMDILTDSLPPIVTDIPIADGHAKHLIYTSVNLSGGYAYNWVINSQWMLHASYMHSLSLWHYGEMAYATHTIPLGHAQGHNGLVRLGAIWDNNRYFGGFTGTMQILWISHTPLYLQDFYVATRLFFGFRF